jgi:DNA-binding response OmpR family regulator
MVAIHSPMVDTAFLHNQSILIAESKGLTCEPIKTRLTQLGAIVHHCRTTEELIKTYQHLQPQLLLLGTLPKTNTLNFFRQYRDIWNKTPVILLAHQPTVNDYFRNWAISQGIVNVVSSAPQNFAELQSTIKNTLFPVLKPNEFKSKTKVIPLRPSTRIEKNSSPESLESDPVTLLSTFSRYDAAIALNQISSFSKKYFGNLAVGNYWRKTQDYLLENYPGLRRWQVNHWGEFDPFLFETPELEELLSEEELDSLKTWVLLFVKECERIVVDFSQLLQQHSNNNKNVNFKFLL